MTVMFGLTYLMLGAFPRQFWTVASATIFLAAAFALGIVGLRKRAANKAG